MSSLRKFNILEMLGSLPPRTNINAIHIDRDYAVRIARIAGRFPWHHHPNGDEGWFVYQGAVSIETSSGAIELSAGEGTVIPCGLEHSPVAQVEGTTVIIFNRTNLGMEMRSGERVPEDFRILEGPPEPEA
jgi:hypothetical protein